MWTQDRPKGPTYISICRVGKIIPFLIKPLQIVYFVLLEAEKSLKEQFYFASFVKSSNCSKIKTKIGYGY